MNRWNEAPVAWLVPRDGELWIDLPVHLTRIARVRVGVRAVDTVGSQSAPSEAEIELAPAMR